MSMFQPLVDLGTKAVKGVGDVASGAWDWLGSGDNMRNAGSLIGGLGSAYGAYTQADMAKKMIDLQKADYNRQKKRQEEAEDALALGFANSGFGQSA